jgi:endonuclease/exonuclease/phosphatase family metal-dependent hydrolase
MRKIIKWIIRILVVVIIVPLIAFLTVECWYLPRFLSNKEKVELDMTETSEITVMSSNVRCFSPTDYFKKSWFYRAKLIRDDINEVKPDIIGFQEVTWMHYGYLQDVMEGYDSVITYRDKFILSEGCPIFYREDKFELIDKGSFWLSETPEKMSKDWGAACYRITSYVILKVKATGKELVVFNTHLDHVSDEARIKGINVVLDKIKEFGGKPSIIMGDFNAYVGSPTINAAYESFNDAHNVADINLQAGQKEATYQNWGTKLNNKRIDFFMVSKTGIDVNTFDVLDRTHDGVYASDHFPIYIEIELE